MNRIERLETQQAKLEQRLFERKGKKKFRFPFKAKSKLNKIKRMPDYVVSQYLTQNKDVIWKLCKVVSGNIIVVNNKAHIINPKYLWRFGKYFWYIHREIDRMPVSNEDYDKVKFRKDDTEADVPLIKAVLGAIQKQSALKKPNIGIIIGVIVVIIIGLILFL